MSFSIKSREDLENLNKLVSSNNQVEGLRLQYKLGKQNFHDNVKNVFEPVTDTIKNSSEDFTKTMMLTSKENNKALENSNNKLLQIMNERGILASFSLTPSSKISNPEITS